MYVVLTGDLKSSRKIKDIVTCLLNFMAEVMWGWSKRQKDVIMYYRKVKSKKSNATLEEISTNIGIKKTNII